VVFTSGLVVRVLSTELQSKVRNCRTHQLAENPATERSRGSFIFRLVCKGLRAVPGEAFGVRERARTTRERVLRHRKRGTPETSQNPASEKASQLTDRLASDPRSQPLHKKQSASRDSDARPTSLPWRSTSTRRPAPTGVPSSHFQIDPHANAAILNLT